MHNVGEELKFNTGRSYSKDGQIIEALIVDVKENTLTPYEVKFNDLSRGISGIVSVYDFTQSAIMDAYDNCSYKAC